ncbi:NBAS subunit of NRZ tethering complex [Eucyclogobius newberryi]|uniref:NBAS subunit of NRZ tethering complex n=1 Tax=Eucyclogobius newberryi TaxID=166745 RepID=UPI003B5C6A72
MAEDSLIVSDEENILYDLLVITEWSPETDTQQRGNKEYSSSIIAKAVTGPFRLILHYLWYSPTSSFLPPGLIRLSNKQINWQLVLSSNGKLLAVVQDQCVEIRSVRDDFGSVIGKCQVPKDPCPQWRRVAWSYDCILLAYADSTGTVRLFDLMGSELFVIPPEVSFPGDFSCAVAGLIFLEYTASAQWSAELLVITYRGGLKSYLVSVGTNQNFRENHSFSFSGHYSHGITSVIYHPGHRLLLVGGCEAGDESASRALCNGITAWRALSGFPHYKQVTCHEDEVSTNPKRGFFRMPSFRLFSRQGDEMDGVFRMNLSPDGTLLAVIHFSGRLSLWDVPSLRQRATWSQDQQPGFEEINPELKTSLERWKKIKDKEQYYPLVDVSWWSDNVMILARCSGSVTVSSVRTLRNLLGKSCEWFEPSPRLTTAYNGGFLSLECEVKLAQKRGRLNTVSSEDEDADDGGDSDSDDESSAKARYFGYIKQGLYYVTEMERFAPPRKRPCTVIKNYRLVSLRSTTPEELYQRKIDNEEYGEALSLAHAYNLDSDLVYQRQWRKSTVSIASIQDYLSKIRKRSWVLHECVERVPENVDAAKELLMYGLKGTDLEALVAIGNREDEGRFIMPGDVDLDDLPYDDLLPEDEEGDIKKEKENKKRQELLDRVDFSRLTLEQKELCRSRLKLLCYLDRLATYEEILGGPHAAEQKYDAEFFKKFRSQNIVLSARDYAQESNVQALDILFTYHGAELLQHRLTVLCNFPETTSPHEYIILLPEAIMDDNGTLALIPWDEQRHREMDWCEADECRAVLDQHVFDNDDFLYEESPELLRFRSTAPSIQLLTDWYQTRAKDIEFNSRQVDCALSLVRLGKEREIPGLESLCDDLVTMETLVYETCELSLTLKDLQHLSDIDKLRLLMKNSSLERYVKDCFQWMVPFLHRCEGKTEGVSKSLLREYLVSLSQHDLTLPLIIFQHSKPDSQQKIIGDPDQLMQVALESIYSCERDDQLSLCYDILECLPQRGYGPETDITPSLHDQVDKLEKHLSVVEVLEKHGLQKPISFVRNSQTSEEEAYQLMVKLCRHNGRKKPPISETVWRGLLQDLLDMQHSVYTCLKPETCHQVFVESLLCSSLVENVRLAGQLMHCSKMNQDVPVSLSFRGKGYSIKVSYGNSVDLVLAAAREYFNSSKTLTDPCMQLARACLQLITDCPVAIQEELDLISALGQLQDFSVNILPLQVRLQSDRLSLIKECIAQCSKAYKQSATLLNLASLLRVAGTDEATRKGQVLTLLAEQALQSPDFKASYIHCRDLMSAGYCAAWDVCSQLGQCEDYGDLQARQELLAFSLTHCPPDNIHGLLAASSDLQTQVLYQAVNYQMEPEKSPPGDEPDPAKVSTPALGSPVGKASDLLHRTTAKTMEVLTTTGLTTKAVLTAVSDHHWWKESINYLRPSQGHRAGATSREGACENSNVQRQGCSPFYQDLIDDPYVDPSQDVYSSYQDVMQEDFAEVLFRTGKLAEAKTEGQTLFPATEVLLQLANDAFPRDMMLALSYLLALPQVLDANKCFEKQCHSALSLQLAAYYYSLQIYSRLAPCFKDKNHTLYQADPKEMIRLVTQHVSSYSGWPQELQKLIEQLQMYNERLMDFTQAQVLQGLGRGVDVSRFSSDADYKKETILGLTETLDDGVYKIALSLAKRYSVPQWEVYMTHLEFLFTDSGLSTKDIESCNDSRGLFDTLKSDPEAFHSHMNKYVLPSVDAKDMGRLLYYYTLLDAAGCHPYVSTAIKPDSHVKLLKKLRAVASGLDYRKLTDESLNPLLTLEPVLTSQNVLSISKLATRLPMPGAQGETVSPSAVHSVWLKKLFWRGDPQLLKRAPQGDQDYLHAYDTCAKYLDRLVPSDAVDFLDNITFSPDAVEYLSISARSEVIKRATKALRQLAEKSRKKGAVEQEEKDPAGMSFDEALSHLQQSQSHLETLSQPCILSLRDSRQEQLQGYSRLYDLSRSNRTKVHELAVTMATNGHPLEQIGKVLRVAVGPLDLSVKTVLHDAVGRVVSALSGDSNALTKYPQPLMVLESMVTAVHRNVQSGDSDVTSDDLLAWLRPFCGDSALPVRPRIDLLQILENNFSLKDSDVRLLLLYRTQAVLKDREFQIEDVENEDKRYALFLELLESAQKWEDFQLIMLLLQAWPPMIKDDIAATERNPWVVLTSALLTRLQGSGATLDCGQQVVAMVRPLYTTKHKLPVQCIKSIATLLLQQPGLQQSALKLMSESADEELLRLTLDQVNSMNQDACSQCDTELLSLLLDAGLLVGCVSSPLYPLLSSHMLSHHSKGGWDVEAAATALLSAGHAAEAGSLLLAHRGTHQSHFTFNTALAVLKKWL